MAGSTLYLGNLFENMITALNSQITKVDTMIASLNAINLATGQSITAGKITASANVKKTIASAEILNTGNTTYNEVARATVYADGTVRILARLKTSATDAMGLYYSIDGGTTKVAVKAFTALVGTYTEYYLDIPITYGKTIILYAYVSMSSKTLYIDANGLRFGGDLINLAVDGYII